MTEAEAVGLDQVQEPVLAEIGLDVLNVGNMIISLRTIQIHKQKKSQSRYNKCIIRQRLNSIKSFSSRHI